MEQIFIPMRGRKIVGKERFSASVKWKKYSDTQGLNFHETRIFQASNFLILHEFTRGKFDNDFATGVIIKEDYTTSFPSLLIKN